jgi:hypothetical protein
MRTIMSAVFVAAGFAVAVGSPDTASANTIPFTSVPVVASVAAPAPAAAPEKIPAGERAEGVFPAIVPLASRKSLEEQGYRYVYVFTNEKEAQAYAADGSITSTGVRDPSAPRMCLSSASTGGEQSPFLSLFMRTKPYVQPKMSPQTIAALKRLHRWPPPPVSKEPLKDTISPMHAERLTQTADSVTLDTTDGFLDLNTMGARVTSKSSVKLTKVTTGPNNLIVYAARDDKGNTQFLVTNPELPATTSDEDRQALAQRLSGTANRLVAQMPTGTSSSTGCGYVKFTLTAKAGTGQMATVLATAFLPPAKDSDDNAEPDMSRFEAEGMTPEQLKQVHDELRRENRSQRARALAINVSLSQLASEPSPLLSVTFGWASKDEQFRF